MRPHMSRWAVIVFVDLQGRDDPVDGRHHSKVITPAGAIVLQIAAVAHRPRGDSA